MLSRIATRLSKTWSAQCRNSLLLLAHQKQQPYVNVPLLSRKFHSLQDSQRKLVAAEVSLLRHSLSKGSSLQRFGFLSSASLQPNQKEASQSGKEQGTAAKNCVTADSEAETTNVSGKEFKSDLGSVLDDENLSKDELINIVKKVEELLKVKDKEFLACMEKNMDNESMKIVKKLEELLKVKDECLVRREQDNSRMKLDNICASVLLFCILAFALFPS